MDSTTSNLLAIMVILLLSRVNNHCQTRITMMGIEIISRIESEAIPNARTSKGGQFNAEEMLLLRNQMQYNWVKGLLYHCTQRIGLMLLWGYYQEWQWQCSSYWNVFDDEGGYWSRFQLHVVLKWIIHRERMVVMVVDQEQVRRNYLRMRKWHSLC